MRTLDFETAVKAVFSFKFNSDQFCFSQGACAVDAPSGLINIRFLKKDGNEFYVDELDNDADYFCFVEERENEFDLVVISKKDLKRFLRKYINSKAPCSFSFSKLVESDADYQYHNVRPDTKV